MKEIMKKLLLELLKNSKRSDREIAKVLGVSQPTITRTRQKLVSEGVIKEFTVIPDFRKMGYEIMAITCVKAKYKVGLKEKGKEWMKTHPNVIFTARAQGMGKNAVMISLHKNYSDFSSFLTNHLLEMGDNIEDHDTLLVGLGEGVLKPLSLKYLAELEETS